MWSLPPGTKRYSEGLFALAGVRSGASRDFAGRHRDSEPGLGNEKSGGASARGKGGWRDLINIVLGGGESGVCHEGRNSIAV